MFFTLKPLILVIYALVFYESTTRSFRNYEFYTATIPLCDILRSRTAQICRSYIRQKATEQDLESRVAFPALWPMVTRVVD